MRKLIVAGLLFGLCGAANAEDTSEASESTTDLSPLACAWEQLSEEEQTGLREAFKTEKTGKTDYVLHFPVATTEQVQRVAAACNLSYSEAQMSNLARALGAKGAEELARWGIGQRGAIPMDMIDKTIAEMHDGKRVVIGDEMSCGDGHITREWDHSAAGAMRRAGVRTVDGRSVALLSVALFSKFNQEGYMRRVNAAAEACSA